MFIKFTIGVVYEVSRFHESLFYHDTILQNMKHHKIVKPQYVIIIKNHEN